MVMFADNNRSTIKRSMLGGGGGGGRGILKKGKNDVVYYLRYINLPTGKWS